MPSLQFYFFRAFMPLMRRAQARMDVDDLDTLVRFRARADRLANILYHPRRDVHIESGTVAGVPGDWFIPENAPDDPVLLFLHGGGIIFGWINPNRRILANIAQFAGLRAFGLDYRTMPGNPYPAAHLDCFNVYQSLIHAGKQIVLIGESSGGVLALATLLRAREAGLAQPRLSVLLGPVVDYRYTHQEFWNFNDVFADPGYTSGLHRHYTAGCDLTCPDLSPIDADLSDLGPIYLLVGENDITRAEAERLAESAHRYHLDLDLEIWPHVWHGWYLFAPQLPEGTQALQRLGSVIIEYVATANHFQT